MKSLLQHTLILHMCSQNFNRKLLLENRRCKAAKKKFACTPAGSYKLISLVQAKFSVSLHRSRLACCPPLSMWLGRHLSTTHKWTEEQKTRASVKEFFQHHMSNLCGAFSLLMCLMLTSLHSTKRILPEKMGKTTVQENKQSTSN